MKHNNITFNSLKCQTKILKDNLNVSIYISIKNVWFRHDNEFNI